MDSNPQIEQNGRVEKLYHLYLAYLFWGSNAINHRVRTAIYAEDLKFVFSFLHTAKNKFYDIPRPFRTNWRLWQTASRNSSHSTRNWLVTSVFTVSVLIIWFPASTVGVPGPSPDCRHPHWMSAAREYRTYTFEPSIGTLFFNRFYRFQNLWSVLGVLFAGIIALFPFVMGAIHDWFWSNCRLMGCCLSTRAYSHNQWFYFDKQHSPLETSDAILSAFPFNGCHLASYHVLKLSANRK